VSRQHTLRELADGETALAFEAMQALRPHFDDRDRFTARVDEQQRPEGYRLVAALPPGEDSADAVAGFRTGHNLAWGDYLYFDDLSTHPRARGQGLAGGLLDWLLDEARRLGCDSFHLDSGFGAERTDAHRLYLNKGLAVASLHFGRHLRA
jgi:GNAT superfamily N-acetyltransferase